MDIELLKTNQIISKLQNRQNWTAEALNKNTAKFFRNFLATIVSENSCLRSVSLKGLRVSVTLEVDQR